MGENARVAILRRKRVVGDRANGATEWESRGMAAERRGSMDDGAMSIEVLRRRDERNTFGGSAAVRRGTHLSQSQALGGWAPQRP